MPPTALASPDQPESEQDTAKIMREEIAKDEQPKALTLRDTGATSLLDPNIYLQMKALAKDFIDSKAIPQCWSTASQVLVGLQTGVEMGMMPMEAMNSLYVVNGAINIWGKAITRRLQVHGYTVRYTNETVDYVTAVVTKGREKYTESYSFDEAVASGYTDRTNLKVGWRPGINRKLKLRYGVLNIIIKTYIPQVLGSAANMVEIAEDFDPIEVPNIAKADDRKAKILAAENKHKQLTDKKFKPKGLKQTSFIDDGNDNQGTPGA